MGFTITSWPWFIVWVLIFVTMLSVTARWYYIRGKENGKAELLRHMSENQPAAPRTFIQGSPDRKTARVSTGRIVARRQPKPSPRRGERDKQQ